MFIFVHFSNVYLMLLCDYTFMILGQNTIINHYICIFLGINIFLDGFIPTENLRFRDESLVFKVSESATEDEIKRMCRYNYPDMKKSMGKFKLEVIIR